MPVTGYELSKNVGIKAESQTWYRYSPLGHRVIAGYPEHLLFAGYGITTNYLHLWKVIQVSAHVRGAGHGYSAQPVRLTSVRGWQGGDISPIGFLFLVFKHDCFLNLLLIIIMLNLIYDNPLPHTKFLCTPLATTDWIIGAQFRPFLPSPDDGRHQRINTNSEHPRPAGSNLLCVPPKFYW